MSEMGNEKKETVMDVVTEMRNVGDSSDLSSLEWWVCEKMFCYADRIEAAFDRLAVPTAEQWTEIARQEAEIADLKRENARLLAALKPVVECRVMSAVTAEIAPGRSDYCASIIEKAQRAYNKETNNMKGKKKTLALIAGMNEIERLKELQDELHDCAYLAATDDRDRDVMYYCECEDACRRRIRELKGAEQ